MFRFHLTGDAEDFTSILLPADRTVLCVLTANKWSLGFRGLNTGGLVKGLRGGG